MVATVSFYRGTVKAKPSAQGCGWAEPRIKGGACKVQRPTGETAARQVHVPGECDQPVGAEIRDVEVADSAAAVRDFFTPLSLFRGRLLEDGDQFDAFFLAQVARVLPVCGIVPVLVHAQAG